eukprot:3505396-Pleurochrysis_carterae.AAC.1
MEASLPTVANPKLIAHFCDYCIELDDIWLLFAQLTESPYVGSHFQMPAMAMKLFCQDLWRSTTYASSIMEVLSDRLNKTQYRK